jgi:hypothetical protein
MFREPTRCSRNQPAEAALFRLAVELYDLAIPLPKLDAVAVHELLCRFNRRVVVGAIKLNHPHKVAVFPNDINSIIGHLRHPRSQKAIDDAITKIAERLFGPGLEMNKTAFFQRGGRAWCQADRGLLRYTAR